MEKIVLNKHDIELRTKETNSSFLLQGAMLAAIETHPDINQHTDLVNAFARDYYQFNIFDHTRAIRLLEELRIGRELRIPVNSGPINEVEILNRPTRWFEEVKGEGTVNRNILYNTMNTDNLFSDN